MTAAIYYHPEAYTTTGQKLMGRNAAGESFLRGFLKHSRGNRFWVQVQHPEHAGHFIEAVSRNGRTEPVTTIDKHSLADLSQAGVVYHPGPGLGEQARQRALAGGARGHAAWSLCGITHTTSSAGAMDALAELITAPIQPWDAVICTSHAVKDNVSRLLQAQQAYLEERLGISRIVLPQLPVIPLGIHVDDFACSEAQRAVARQALGAGAETLVVLFTGRLSFHAKAHPLAMYQALERAARSSGKEVVLVECGWFANEPIEKAYEAARALACPGVRVVTLDGRQADQRQMAWAGADVFCSLSDNIQETFGIVPIEAMAAGLPVVVSDWDGYKDTVRGGVDGFRIPTIMPQAGLGHDLARRHALGIDSYDMYCGHNCMLVAIDIDAAAQAFAALFSAPELRRRMGESGRQRARAIYDWQPVIGQYEDLWAALAERRQAHAPAVSKVPVWPARMDPFQAFAAYPTRTLTPQTPLALVDGGVSLALQRVQQYRQLAMVSFAQRVLPGEAEIEAVLGQLASGPQRAELVVGALPAARRALVFRGLAWLLKMGVVRIAT